MQHYTRVIFHRFKAYKSFTLSLRDFNILVGPNNAGKSTILSAFRILAAAFRRAEARKATLVHTALGTKFAHTIDISDISVASENVFFNYEEDEPATVTFFLSDGKTLQLYFPERDVCYFIPDANGQRCETPSQFKKHFKCPIGFVPILGPVDHHEPLYEKEAARRALINHTASRNFRNIWYHYPERFYDFQEAIRVSWPGMDIEPPEIDTTHDRARLHMFCPEGRKPREIFWSGFGFQVWCQMLTHLIQSREASIFLIDEPDIYLHSDLQRQLIGMLRTLGPDILIATHSTEIISEADSEEIVIINKGKQRSQRINNPSQLDSVFQSLGSNVNPILTQLAKTRKAIFVEGKDFQVFSKFARKIGELKVANRSTFAVIPIGGFNPERAKNLKEGMELTLGTSVQSATILDRDYRSDAECLYIVERSSYFNEFVEIHDRKEIENFLLIPDAIDRAAQRRLSERCLRTGDSIVYEPIVEQALTNYYLGVKSYVAGQYLSLFRRFEKARNPNAYEEEITKNAYEWFEGKWTDLDNISRLISGKDALSAINMSLQNRYQISVTNTAIIDAMTQAEIPTDMSNLILRIAKFAC